MNYLAHAIRVLDDPWQVAGTSMPDWLRVVDKRARIKPNELRAVDVEHGSIEARVRDGVLRHHDDDHAFHTNATFDALTDECVRAIRALSDDARLRASALGHIAVEMMLDACIEETKPGATAAYYDALTSLDRARLFEITRAFSKAALPSLSIMFERFTRARFLFQYASDDGVVDALKGVAWRAGFDGPPPGTESVIARMRPKVRAAASDLLRFHS